MTQGYIRLEIDPEDYEKVKSQLQGLYLVAERTGHQVRIIEESIKATQSIFPGFVVGFFFGLIISTAFTLVLF